MGLIEFAERGVVPDWLIRIWIRKLLRSRIRQESVVDPDAGSQAAEQFLDAMRNSPLAEDTDKANEQHYEVPAEFFEIVLGPRLKYSCCLYPTAETDLAEAEQRMLELTCQRAQLEDGMDILELGCGWGSLTRWMAQQFPQSRIVAISNSHGQREFIEERCRRENLTNVRVVTADMR
jgi:cyclopropane-fatty-acyl-phospholipid synthase